MKRRRWWRWAAVIVLGLVAVVAIRMQAVHAGRTVHDSGAGGPLDGGEASDTISIWAAEIGQGLTMGHLVVSNEGDKPLVLERLRLLPALPDGLEVIGVVTAQDRERRIATVGAGRTYPPDPEQVGTTRPLRGTVVPPDNPEDRLDRGTAILVGLRLTRAGVFGFDRMEVDYRVGEKRYTMRVDIGFLGCGPPANYPNECPEARSKDIS